MKSKNNRRPVCMVFSPEFFLLLLFPAHAMMKEMVNIEVMRVRNKGEYRCFQPKVIMRKKTKFTTF